MLCFINMLRVRRISKICYTFFMFDVTYSTLYRLFSFMSLAFYLLGLLNAYFSDKKDACEMTYMFEYPQFVRITLPDKDHPQYGLFAYAEGRMTEKARKMKFNGIPVLFLPGNSGSHMQSRSLASVALRKALSDAYDYHFDYFTVSFNEDLSALNGGVLFDETIFAIKCINKILTLYENNRYTRTVPTEVILIGHSMGGVIAKRLLAFSSTINTANIAIALASPLQAPVVNYDENMNLFYNLIDKEWDSVNRTESLKSRKMLMSFGCGIRDVLMPSCLTSSSDNDITTLTTAIPGVWVSPDHVSIVWCKQLVLTINRFLFSIVDPNTKQVVEDKEFLMAKARQFFVANRSMTLSPDITRPNVTMIPDAFWYEDNRRKYQITRPEISKMTYLMIRLVNFPQNRFVAIESVNVDDKDWIFGCSAEFTHGTHRYCKRATSLTELSRWSSAVEGAGRRKLATVHLHDIMAREPNWTHVIVKVSPTRKPIVLNVDINDLASRQITVDLNHYLYLTHSKQVILQQTEPSSLYYEVMLPHFSTIHQAFWLHVEPTASCQAKEYHVTAEMHVPWAPNHEFFHHFTHADRSPMKLRLLTTSPNFRAMYKDHEDESPVKVTFLLDPQCCFTISITSSWYHRFAQLARNYSPMIVPYMAAILLLVAGGALNEMSLRGRIPSMHSALASFYIMPVPVLASGIIGLILTYIPVVSEYLSSNHAELDGVKCAWIRVWIFYVALGLLNVLEAAIILAMVFSTQLFNKLFYRIIWRGRPALAERAAEGFRQMPMLVGIGISSIVPWTCGAVALAIGGAYYAYVLSNMYQEYLEDYIYKIMAIMAARVSRAFNSKKPTATSAPAESQDAPAIEGSEPAIEDNESAIEVIEAKEVKAIEGPSGSDYDKIEKTGVRRRGKKLKGELNAGESRKGETSTEVSTRLEGETSTTEEKAKGKKPDERPSQVQDYESSPTTALHFHMIMFSLWMVVLLINVPVLITWARNFPNRMKLDPDPSLYTGYALAGCGTSLWQPSVRPLQKLRNYNWVSGLLMILAMVVLALGPRALFVVNYTVSIAFLLITAQLLRDTVVLSDEYPFQRGADSNDNAEKDSNGEGASNSEQDNATSSGQNAASSVPDTKSSGQDASSSGQTSNTENKEGAASSEGNQCDSEDKSEGDNATSAGNDCLIDESLIYTVFKNLREKFTTIEEL